MNVKDGFFKKMKIDKGKHDGNWNQTEDGVLRKNKTPRKKQSGFDLKKIDYNKEKTVTLKRKIMVN